MTAPELNGHEHEVLHPPRTAEGFGVCDCGGRFSGEVEKGESVDGRKTVTLLRKGRSLK